MATVHLLGVSVRPGAAIAPYHIVNGGGPRRACLRMHAPWAMNDGAETDYAEGAETMQARRVARRGCFFL